MTSNGTKRSASPASGTGKKRPRTPVISSSYQHLTDAVLSASGIAGTKMLRTDAGSGHKHSTNVVLCKQEGAKRIKREDGGRTPIISAAASLPLKSSSSSTSGFTCVICMDEKSDHELFKTKSCSHPFCTQCVAQYVINKIEENSAKVNCPEPSCKMFIEHGDCRGIISKEWLNKWGALTCESQIPVSQKFYCPFKECSALLVDDTGNVTTSECPICHRLFCAQCKVPWHQDMSCAQFQSNLDPEDERRKDKMVDDLAKKKKWKRCPKCMYYVEKRGGCDHIRCRCKHHFCYRCGKRWGARHNCNIWAMIMNFIF